MTFSSFREATNTSREATRVHLFAALSQLSHSVKNQEKRKIKENSGIITVAGNM